MNYNCPMCQAVMVVEKGSKLNPQDGVTIWCSNKACSAQEVMGHGDNEKEAWYVVQCKFIKREERTI